MLLLDKSQSAVWSAAGDRILEEGITPESFDMASVCGKDFEGMFCFFAGTHLASKGMVAEGKGWLAAGASREDEGIFSNAFLAAFLKRQSNKFTMPAVCFEEPTPFVHFAGVPHMKSARESFIRSASRSLPDFKRPFRILDAGTGNGALLVMLLSSLRKLGKLSEMDEIVLLDSSKAMVELASANVSTAFPNERISTVAAKMQDPGIPLQGHFDVILFSLSFHHMPYEVKAQRLPELAKDASHILLFELDANNDTPELGSPELACSVYQSYGRVIDYVFSHDAPLELANTCVDSFLLTEELSFLTEPRGVRSDYHMLRSQWHSLFQESLKGSFSCLSETTCLHDDYLDLFGLHYARS